MVPFHVHMEKTYHFKVLGCRMNHAERREMESILVDRGMKPSDESPDLEIVHTCSVTGQAAAKSRNAIRRAARSGRYVLVTGCFTGTDPEVAAELGDSVVTQAGDAPMLERFANEVDHWLDTPRRQPPRPSSTTLPIATLPTTRSPHIRAELRIQDGCDAHCTFCIIPKIRTTLRSKTIHDTVTEATRLVELGHKEIVLTGIFIGAYGHETALRRKQHGSTGEHLADLLDAVAQVEGLRRLRISSMEPGDVTPVLLDAMVANMDVVVPHLHLPLQSGSNAVLQKMNRQYNCDQYVEMVGMVNERLCIEGIPPAITTDIICGFPTETEDDFERTIAVASNVGYLHMHIFPYSVRSGTAAARWVQHSPEVIRNRVRRLHTLGGRLSLEYRKKLIGKELSVLIEQQMDKSGFFKGRSSHYAEITLRADVAIGDLVHAKVLEVDGETTRGIPSLTVM